mmetsp:Transcript_15368/g.35433  ORF Transcript_15368/g.35433 Transcript_15368/m.35433 type:complete len:134 (-) Transcript_15368:117-518(-)
MGIVKIRLVKATNLADKDVIGKSDPYVRLELKQDNFLRDVDYGYQKSSVKQGDLNPVWNEDFSFHNIKTLENLVLKLEVMDSDIGSKDDKNGSCKIRLDKEGITSSPKRIEKTIDHNLLRANGKIVVDISFEH